MNNAQIASTVACPPGRSVGNLLTGLHRDPALRTWVAVESTALAPVPEADGDDWTLWSLLAEPVGLGAARLTYRPAWGAVQWDWSSGRVRQRLRLAAALFPTGGAGLWSVRPDGDAHARRAALIERVTALLDTPPADARGLAGLADAYHGLLPLPAYAAYHTLVPATAAWLRPATTS
jgi:hypothetical protein